MSPTTVMRAIHEGRLFAVRVSDRDLGRDVNIVNYARAELDRLSDGGDPFVLAVLDGPRVPIIGPQVG